MCRRVVINPISASIINKGSQVSELNIFIDKS